MIDRLAALRDALERERSLPATDRATNASDAALDSTIDDVCRAVAKVAKGHDEHALAAMTQAALRVTKSWSYASPLSESVVRCKQDLQHAVDEAFARAWSQDSSTRAVFRTPPHRPPRTDERPFPRRVTYAVIVVAVVIGALTVAVMDDQGWSAIAGPFAGPGVAVTVVAVVRAWWIGSAARLRVRVVTHLRALALAIRSELAMSRQARATRASDHSLTSSLAVVEEALQTFAHGSEDAGVKAVERLGPIAGDWAPRAAASVTAARTVRIGRRLSKAARWTGRVDQAAPAHHTSEEPPHVKDWWLVRFPVYSLFVAIGSVGLHQDGLLSSTGAVAMTGAGVLSVALWRLHRQSRAADRHE